MKNRSTFCILALGAVFTFSAAALEFRHEKNISYYPEEVLRREGEYARKRCLLDVKWPVGVKGFATVVNFHGGGIVKGRKSPPAWPREGRDRDPVAFVSGGYRLLTNATPAQAVSDAAAVVAWTLKNIAKYGGDPKKVFVTGISAGGYLTAMVGMDYRWLAVHGFKPTDLAGIAPLTGQMTKHFNVRKIGFKDTDPQFMPKIDEWAPLFYARKDPLPPSCFLTGGRDIEWKARVEENALLAASIRACGHTNCEFHETEGNHGGGVYFSGYYLRDFVARTCDAGILGRFADGERVAFTGDSALSDAPWHVYLQLFWSTRYPGSDVRINASASEGVKTVRFPSAVYGDLPDPGKVRPDGNRNLLMTAKVLEAMCVDPWVAHVAVDARRGIVYRPSDRKHADAKGVKLRDTMNAVVDEVSVRADGVAFTYAPKSLPFPSVKEYAQADSVYSLTKRFNREIFKIENLPAGKYALFFDGRKAGEFAASEFDTGVNVALLDTPNSRAAAAAAEIAGLLADSKDLGPDGTDDLYARLNAVRPPVSRVTLKLMKK